MGDIDDRWFRVLKDEDGNEVRGADGKPVKVPTTRHGKGLRYAARYRDDHHRQKSKSFKTTKNARAFLAKTETDLNKGAYVDHLAGRIKLADHIENWLSSQTSNITSQYQVALRLRTHVVPTHGHYELRAITPSVAQAWIKGVRGTLADNYVRVIVGNFSSVMQAAVDDRLIAANPFAARSVNAPALQSAKVVPWTAGQVDGIRVALPDRYCELVTVAAGLGLRQGEAFGLAVEDVDFLRRVVHVRRQVKLLEGHKFFALPKRGKTRDVPLPKSVALRLAQYLESFPAAMVELPWETPSGKPVEARLLFRSANDAAINRNTFSERVWAPARKLAGVPAGRENGMHALRHFFASIVLADGTSIRDLADWLGHEDPGFTLRVYSHLMPASADRMRETIDRAFDPSVQSTNISGK